MVPPKKSFLKISIKYGFSVIFTQLQQLLLQSRQFSTDYWHDCALFEAENCLQSFQAHDWQALEQALPTQNAYWKQRCIDVLAACPSAESIAVLSLLCDDAESRTAYTAAQALLDLSRKSNLHDGIAAALVSALDKAQTVKRKNSIFSRLQQRFFFHPAV